MNWKKNLVPAMWALAGVVTLVPAVLKPVIKGEPFNKVWLAIGFMFLTFAVSFFAISRKSGGGSGPPGT